MKTTHILSAALLAALSLTSCSDDEPGSISGSDVEISATIGSTTRTTPYAQGEAARAFSDGDVIYVESGSQNCSYVYGGGTWSPVGSSRIKWIYSQMDFSAVYPSAAHEGTFTLPTDQSTAEAVSSADYMTYSGRHGRSSGAVSMTMERQTARVVVTPVVCEDMAEAGAEVTSVTVHADINPGSEETISAIKPYAGNGSYTVLAAPTSDGSATDRAFLDIAVTMPGSAEKHLVMSGMHALEKGMSYNLTVRIGKDYLTLEDISISPWTDKPVQDFEICTGRILLKTPGTLTTEAIKSAIGFDDYLKIEGPMNGSDVKVLREFMGCKYDLSKSDFPSPIHYLDMGGVNIVIGGDVYAYEFSMGKLHVSDNDIIPSLMFSNLQSDSPMHIVLPRGTRSIQDNAFIFSEIDFIDLPETLEKIDYEAFAYSRIQEIKIPGRVTFINASAFRECTNLKRVEISEGITSINISSIVQDYKLEYLYLPYSLSSSSPRKIATDNLKTFKIMTKPGVLAASSITLTKGGGNITGEHIDCDLYLCNERQDEVTEGNTWAGNTWKSITFVDGTTLNK